MSRVAPLGKRLWKRSSGVWGEGGAAFDRPALTIVVGAFSRRVDVGGGSKMIFRNHHQLGISKPYANRRTSER